MCEDCEATRKEIWSEIQDIVSGTGKISDHIQQRMETARERGIPMPDDPLEREQLLDGVRAHMLAERAAMLARFTPNTAWHMQAGSIILGSWAAEMMEEEIPVLLSAISNLGSPDPLANFDGRLN